MKFDDWINNYKENTSGIDCLNGQRRRRGIYPTEMDEIREFVDVAFPWALYVIGIDNFEIKQEGHINNWCKENLLGRFDIDIVSYFEFEEDSVSFALRWA